MSEPDTGGAFYGPRSAEAAASGLSPTAGRMGQLADNATDKAPSKLDSAREPIADKLQGAADTLREHADRLPGGEKVAGAARSAADKLESSASYLVSHTAEDIGQDLMTLVKQHPARSMLIAGAVGFLLARALRSD